MFHRFAMSKQSTRAGDIAEAVAALAEPLERHTAAQGQQHQGLKRKGVKRRASTNGTDVVF